MDDLDQSLQALEINPNPDAKFSLSTNNKKLLIYKSYEFKVDNENKNGKVMWRCNESSTCKTRLHTWVTA